MVTRPLLQPPEAECPQSEILAICGRKFVSTYGGILSEPAGNDGLNGTGSGHITDTCDAYDVICAGGVSANNVAPTSDDTIADFSSQGPSPGGRKKPDIVALAAGTNSGGMSVLEQRYVANGRLERSETGTSFASPQVAGAAALLYGAGVTDPLVVKGVLLDSTTLGRADANSAMGTQTAWQPDWGWGELNLDSAYQQRNNFAADGVRARDVRFYRAGVAAGDRATLVWNRRVAGPLVQTIPPQALTLSNLDLFEYDASQNQQASSTSTIDNVEQVRAVQPGTVVYKVKDQSSTVDGLPAEPFALAAKNPLAPLASPKPAVSLSLDRDHVRRGDAVTVTETVRNTSSDIAGSAATASLNLPAGVTVLSGGPTTWTPGGGTLATGATASHQWTVTGTEDGLAQLSATAQTSAYDEDFAASGDAALSVDSTPPAPSIACPANGTDPRLGLSWSASDASAIRGYDIQVASDGGPYLPWLSDQTATSATYTGDAGHGFSFRVRATDDLGNVSAFAECGPVSVGFVAVPPPTGLLPTPPPALPAAAHLQLTSVRVVRGRLIIRGRLAKGATGSVTCTYSVRGRHRLGGRATVRAGLYLLALPLRTPKGVLTVTYLGDRTFAPQRITRRVR
jgi:Subtilase family